MSRSVRGPGGTDLERLFAGWRMAYIKGARRQPGCLFCRLRRPGDDPSRWILARERTGYLMLNAFPYNSGHLMAAVNRHVGTLGGLSEAERRDLWKLVALGESLLARVYHPDGMNVGLNLGRAAGAGVDGHLHLHLVPRWDGDTNFMPTVGGTKVLPEDLSETYSRLAAALPGKRPGRRQRRTR